MVVGLLASIMWLYISHPLSSSSSPELTSCSCVRAMYADHVQCLCPTWCLKCPILYAILYGCKILGVQRLIMYVLYHRWLKVWVCCQWCDHLAWWRFEHLKFVLLLISWLFCRILQLKHFCSDYKHLDGKSSLITYTKPYSHILKTFHPRGKLKSVQKGDIWIMDHSKLHSNFYKKIEMEFWVMDVSIINSVKWTFR